MVVQQGRIRSVIFILTSGFCTLSMWFQLKLVFPSGISGHVVVFFLFYFIEFYFILLKLFIYTETHELFFRKVRQDFQSTFKIGMVTLQYCIEPSK